jgi:hypothetical protein
VLVILGSLYLLFSSQFIINAMLGEMDPIKMAIGLFVLMYFIMIFLIGRNILISGLNKERIEITQNTFSIINQSFIKKEQQDYDIEKINKLQHFGYKKLSVHPIGDPSTDFTGIVEREKMIAVINDFGNISFKYDDNLVRFGKDIPSWDTAIVFKELKEFLNNNIDIVEKSQEPLIEENSDE